MLPLLLPVVSLAGDLIHNIAGHFSRHPKAPKAAVSALPDFAATLAQTQAAPAAAAVPAPVSGTVLAQGVLRQPEIASALARVNPTKPVQLELSAGGDVMLRGANGQANTLTVSPATRTLVTQLYASHQPAVAPGKLTPAAVLAVDPARLSSAAWSALPPRSA